MPSCVAHLRTRCGERLSGAGFARSAAFCAVSASSGDRWPDGGADILGASRPGQRGPVPLRFVRSGAYVAKSVQEIEQVVIRFAADSGDGMQITGDRFTNATAVLGNDLATLPDFPAEIRAPAGSLAGVSGFQLHFADHDILTPGDAPSVLVAMNPAALKTNVRDLQPGGTLIVNSD